MCIARGDWAPLDHDACGCKIVAFNISWGPARDWKKARKEHKKKKTIVKNWSYANKSGTSRTRILFIISHSLVGTEEVQISLFGGHKRLKLRKGSCFTQLQMRHLIHVLKSRFVAHQNKCRSYLQEFFSYLTIFLDIYFLPSSCVRSKIVSDNGPSPLIVKALTWIWYDVNLSRFVIRAQVLVGSVGYVRVMTSSYPLGSKLV